MQSQSTSGIKNETKDGWVRFKMSYSPYGDPNKGNPYKGYKGKGKVQGFNTKVQIKEKTQALFKLN